ncbi:hypothetical protein E2C01_046681 [Portunus trituberculatus]|uniref:Uncharacterized protein n=1 Tax=Portunus trituberculatus TaxID=210409 RepID=A0A5B7G6C6_PORTR|nr:hypothetical protein [Portunus trituberculatus]
MIVQGMVRHKRDKHHTHQLCKGDRHGGNISVVAVAAKQVWWGELAAIGHEGELVGSASEDSEWKVKAGF